MFLPFSDSTRWQSDWHNNIQKHHKLLWMFITDHADRAGVFAAAGMLKMAAMFCLDQGDDPYTEKDLAVFGKENLVKLSNGKWWIVDYIKLHQHDWVCSSAPGQKVVIDSIKANKLPVKIRDGKKPKGQVRTDIARDKEGSHPQSHNGSDEGSPWYGSGNGIGNGSGVDLGNGVGQGLGRGDGLVSKSSKTSKLNSIPDPEEW